VEIRKRKLLDGSLEEPSEKETGHDSLPKKSSDTSKSPKKKKKRKWKNDMNQLTNYCSCKIVETLSHEQHGFPSKNALLKANGKFKEISNPPSPFNVVACYFECHY